VGNYINPLLDTYNIERNPFRKQFLSRSEITN
jgi:hypothetical protein